MVVCDECCFHDHHKARGRLKSPHRRVSSLVALVVVVVVVVVVVAAAAAAAAVVVVVVIVVLTVVIPLRIEIIGQLCSSWS